MQQVRHAVRCRRRRGISLVVALVLVATLGPTQPAASLPPTDPGDGIITTVATTPTFQPHNVAVNPLGNPEWRGRILAPDFVNDRLLFLRDDGTWGEVAVGEGCYDLPILYWWAQGDFCGPADVAVGPDGAVYVAAQDNFQIWRMGPDETTFEVFAGTGEPGAGYADNGDGIPATSARFTRTDRVVVDAANNVYVADQYLVRRITPAGIIENFAGTGERGYSGDGGPATDAMVGDVVDVAVGAAGVYLADTSNRRIRLVDETGTITTVAGNGSTGFAGDGGPALDASIRPFDLVVTDDGSIIFNDSNVRIRHVDASGVIDTIAGDGDYASTGDGGPARDAKVGLGDLALDLHGNLLMSEGGFRKIRRVGWNGSIGGQVEGSVGAGGVTVTLMRAWPSWEVAATTHTGPDGTYAFPAVAVGDYRVRFFDAQGRYQRRWSGGATTYRDAPTSSVSVAETATLYDVVPDVTGAAIVGRVSDAVTGDALGGMWVQLVTEHGYLAGTHTNDQGAYSFRGIPPGDYQVRFVDPAPWQHQSSWWPGVADHAAAGTVTLTDSVVTLDGVLGPWPAGP